MTSAEKKFTAVQIRMDKFVDDRTTESLMEAAQNIADDIVEHGIADPRITQRMNKAFRAARAAYKKDNRDFLKWEKMGKKLLKATLATVKKK